MKFASKVDNWIFLTIWGCVIVSAIAIYSILGEFFGESASTAAFLFPFLLIASSGIALPLLVLYRTYYVVEGDQLTIYGGFITWRIPLSSVRSIKPRRCFISSPALSLDRLEIRYGRFGVVYVSPRDVEGFTAALGKNNVALSNPENES